MTNSHYKNTQLLSLNIKYNSIIANRHFIIGRIHQTAYPAGRIIL